MEPDTASGAEGKGSATGSDSAATFRGLSPEATTKGCEATPGGPTLAQVAPDFGVPREREVLMKQSLNGTLAIVAVGVVLGVIAFAVEGLRWLLIPALFVTVIGGGIPFYKSLNPGG